MLSRKLSVAATLLLLAGGSISKAQQPSGPPAGYYKPPIYPSGLTMGFDIVDRKSYRLFSEAGNYRFDPTTSQIYWLSGPFAANPPSQYRVNDAGNPTIILGTKITVQGPMQGQVITRPYILHPGDRATGTR